MAAVTVTRRTLGPDGVWRASRFLPYPPIVYDRAPRTRRTTKETDMLDAKIEACAQAAHEANRAYCQATGDQSQPIWADAPDWQKTSARVGVQGVLNGNTPEQSHESWMRQKHADGWGYGTVKDAVAKTHPAFVPYSELPPEQKAKDDVYVAVVKAMATALGLEVMPHAPPSKTPMRDSIMGVDAC